MERFVEKGGKRLRYGFTTGSCAAGAAKAAAIMLLSDEKISTVSISTPKGWELSLSVENARVEESSVSCMIRKDAGDDPDSTHGMYIGARVKKTKEAGIRILGGEGIGVVTKKGLDQPVGSAAINSIPRQMILQETRTVIQETGYQGGLEVTIFVPDGVQRARKTYNSRIGIEGGISIIGTTGIVEPMSEKALLDSLRVELNVIRNNGSHQVIVFPGNYGRQFASDHLDVSMENSIKIGNHFGEVLEMISDLKFQEAVFVGHIGKMVKLAGGIMNTHSHHSDARMEILAAHAGACGADKELLQKILSSATCDDALDHLKKDGRMKPVMEKIMERIEYHLRYKLGQELDLKLLVFSNDHGILGWNPSAFSLIRELYPVAIVGMGPGHPDYVLPKAWEALEDAEVLIGGRRHLESLEGRLQMEGKQKMYVEDGLSGALECMKTFHKKKQVACLVSGDPGFYSLTAYLKRNAPEVTFRVVPGISSVTYLFSRLQEMWHPADIVSLHGNNEFPLDRIRSAPVCVLLTDPKNTPGQIARILLDKGVDRTMIVGEDLSYPQEKITRCSLEEAKAMGFENLNVVVLIDEKILPGYPG
ncbi:cobalt-precorrin-5B (C(1))-methyltransferase CbiD [Alkalibacter rhizosphaerae]|uniref:cobalt-precorrin-5B (C(1))-methyltransferase CbiD n=1 Tax=Alkalibacter rhizosphaerae TaxID=2815577 RepID=UPI001FEFB1A0|nr:cobalt-precorrin-5B (C(1))-methyltransferase CbiD [Alkalibacter rhizosphaerae]